MHAQFDVLSPVHDSPRSLSLVLALELVQPDRERLTPDFGATHARERVDRKLVDQRVRALDGLLEHVERDTLATLNDSSTHDETLPESFVSVQLFHGSAFAGKSSVVACLY